MKESLTDEQNCYGRRTMLGRQRQIMNIYECVAVNLLPDIGSDK